jgi:hypothetical protein
MRKHYLVDEAPSKQDQQIAALGADLYPLNDQDEDEPIWGSDPFSIIAHREELGLSNDD